MNYLSRVSLGVLLAAISLSAAAGVLSQRTTTLDSLGPYTDYYFGSTGVAISNDGTRFVAASPTIPSCQPDCGDGTGAAEFFQFINGKWVVHGGWVSGPTSATGYGTGLALSADGSEMFAGFGYSCFMQMNPCNPAQVNILTTQAGAGFSAYFYDPTNTTNLNSNFGSSGALSGDGRVLFVGAPGADFGNYLNEGTGEVVIYTYNGSSWSAPVFITDPAATADDEFGVTVALSADGKTALVGAYNDGSVTAVPTVYVFTQSGGTWTLAQKITNVNVCTQNCLALSDDGDTAIISTDSGANIYTTVSGWSSYATTPVTLPAGGGDGSVAISADASSVLVGTQGTVYQYSLNGGAWIQVWSAVSPTPGDFDGFGITGVALSADKQSALISAGYATVVSGGYSYLGAGAVYVYQSPADLSLTLTAVPASVSLNQQIALDFTATNNDTQVTAYNVTLTDTLPAGLTYISADVAGGTCSASGQTVTCTLPSLAPGAVWQPGITAQVATAGSYTDTATVGSNQPDPSATNNSASVAISMLVPTTSNGSVTTTLGTAVNGTLTGSNPCGCGVPVFSIVTQPTHGTVSLINTTAGAFTYTPAAGFTGADSFTFELANGLGTSAVATENVTVAASGGPVASDGSVTTQESRPVRGTLAATGTGQLTFQIASQPAHGTLRLLNAHRGTFIYIPDFRYTGTDSFTFTASDSTGVSNTATESITVTPVAPVAVPGFVMTREGAPVSGRLRAFGSAPFTYAIAVQPQHGTVVLTNAATGAFTYTPAAGFTGFDQFRFDVSNAGGTSRATPEFVFVRR